MRLRGAQSDYVDPVCGMRLDPAMTAIQIRFQDAEIHFCSQACKDRFESAPHHYKLSKQKGLWRRYLDRLNKVTGGKPPSCCH